MSKISEQIAALLIDVQTMEDENVRLTNALAKRDSELFNYRRDDVARSGKEMFRHVATVKDGVIEAANTGRTVTLKIPSSLSTMTLDRKTSTLEDDVRRLLGLSPYEKVGHKKNDKQYMAKLDKAYGAAQVDAMIKQLRGA